MKFYPKAVLQVLYWQGYFDEQYNLSSAMVEENSLARTATALHRLFPCASPH